MDIRIAPEKIQIESSWKEVLLEEFQKPYMNQLKSFLIQEKQNGKTIFPPGKDIFSAFNLTPFNQVKAVVIGQDPYHGEGQAHGLCFSVRPSIRIPPSLINIYKELETDLNIQPPNHGYLISWAEEGILLLNAVLTVEKSKAGSHQGKGWETFTDQVIHILNREKNNLAFILWGSYAQRKGSFIDRKRHLVIESAHPSPFSAHRGFLGSKPFSQVNNYLQSLGKAPIQWGIPSITGNSLATNNNY